jgi:hypothetical protein
LRRRWIFTRRKEVYMSDPQGEQDGDRLRLVVAALAVEDELPQREIAMIIDKSQAEVSRLYRDAVARGWVLHEIRWPEGTDRRLVDDAVFKDRPELQSRLERLSKQPGEKKRGAFQKLSLTAAAPRMTGMPSGDGRGR